jgi:protein-tyrosine-phosphatase
MTEIGIDISAHRSKSLHEFAGEEFDYVIAVCDAAKEACPFSLVRECACITASTIRQPRLNNCALRHFRVARDQNVWLVQGL